MNPLKVSPDDLLRTVGMLYMEALVLREQIQALTAQQAAMRKRLAELDGQPVPPPSE